MRVKPTTHTGPTQCRAPDRRPANPISEFCRWLRAVEAGDPRREADRAAAALARMGIRVGFDRPRQPRDRR